MTSEVRVSFRAHRLTLYIYIISLDQRSICTWPSQPNGHKRDLQENNSSAFLFHQIIKLSKLPLLLLFFHIRMGITV